MSRNEKSFEKAREEIEDRQLALPTVVKVMKKKRDKRATLLRDRKADPSKATGNFNAHDQEERFYGK